MTLILDAGAFVALERGDRGLAAIVMREGRSGRVPITHGGVLAQVWRGGTGRQFELARVLRAVDVRPLDDELGRAAGVLLGWSGTSDAVDAALICLAQDDDAIVTSDPGDLRTLAEVAGVYVELIPA